MPDGSATARTDALARFLTPAHRRRLRDSIPDADLISPAFDVSEATEPREILILLSTPRSGSTMLCDLLRQNGICIAHEYFNPSAYMPLFAERVGAITGGRLDPAAYLAGLLRLRTFPNGVLGINLHGEHLWAFEIFVAEIEQLPVRYFHLSRRDSVAQAVSFSIAQITGQWSSAYPASRPARYDFARTRGALANISLQEEMIRAFLTQRSATCQRLFYEDILANPEPQLRMFGGPEPDLPVREPGLRRQGGAQNAEFVARFRRDILSPPAPPKGLDRLRDLRRRFF